MRDLQRVSGLCQTKVRCAAYLERQNHANPLKDCPNESARSVVRYPPATLSRLIALNSSSPKILTPEHAPFKEGRHRTSLIAASKSTTWVKQSLCLYSLFSAYVFLFAAWEHDAALPSAYCSPSPPAWPPAASCPRRSSRTRNSSTRVRSDRAVSDKLRTKEVCRARQCSIKSVRAAKVRRITDRASVY
ncbi:hypothetical protein ACVIIV_003398 [Bradyrhizobium sp. USDA 4354]